MGVSAPVRDEWERGLASAFSFAKAARTAELRGDYRAKRFDSRGLHPYSVEWGRVLACENVEPSLADERLDGRDLDPVTMRNRASREAERDFEDDAREGKIDWHHG